MRASRARMPREVRRIWVRNTRVTITISGSTENVTASSSPLRRDIATTMPTSANRSPKIAPTPAVTSSFSESTSWVMRVMRRPIGVRS